MAKATCSGMWAGDVGASGPWLLSCWAPGLVRGWSFSFPGVSWREGLSVPLPLASAVSLGHCVGSGDPDQQPMPDCTESFLGRRAVFPGQQAWVRHILPSFLFFF